MIYLLSIASVQVFCDLTRLSQVLREFNFLLYHQKHCGNRAAASRI